jgi:RimJ/RimL family protein N-acetyltransferase
MAVRLLDVSHDDLPLIEGWLSADHVRRRWGDPRENLQLLRAPPAGSWRALVEADGRKVGLVLWQHPGRQELHEAGLEDLPEGVIDLDILIGEVDATGKGVGAAAIGLVADAVLADPAVPFVIAVAGADNQASLRAFARAGFERDRELCDAGGERCVLLVRRRS